MATTSRHSAPRHSNPVYFLPWRYRLGAPLVALLLLVIGATAAYHYIVPQYDWLDSLHAAVVNVTTTNDRASDLPLTAAGKTLSLVVIVVGVFLLTLLLTQLAAFVVEGRMRELFGRRQLQRRIAALSNHVIVCGFGRMGSLVANELAQAGRDVLVVDNDPQRVELAQREGFLFAEGDAQEDEILEQLALPKASVLFTCLNSDAANLFVTLSAKQFNPKLMIVARAQEAASQSKLQRAGADRVICPQIIGATRMADVVLRPAMVDFVEMAHGGVDLEMDQFQIRPNGWMNNKTLAELNLPRRIGAHVVAVRHEDGQTNYHPQHDLKLIAGDRLILVGRSGASDALEDMQQKEN